MANQKKDYYTNTDYVPKNENVLGYDSEFGNDYYNIKENLVLDSFDVKPHKINIITSIIGLISVSYVTYSFSNYLKYTWNSYFVIFFEVVIYIFILFAIADEIGKSLEIAGKNITIKKFFIIKKQISVYDIDYCELKYQTAFRKREPYNRLVIHYQNSSIGLPDYSFDNFSSLIGYITKFHNIRHTDGRSKLQKFFDNNF